MKKLAQCALLLLVVVSSTISVREDRPVIWLEAYDKVDVKLIGLPVVKVA